MFKLSKAFLLQSLLMPSLSVRHGFGLAISLLILGTSSPSFAETLSFPQVWSQINAKSPAQESSRLETQALQEAHSRTQLRWAPKLYLEGKSVNSNLTDPTLSNKGALGLDLPLYEGGLNSAQREFLQQNLKSQRILPPKLTRTILKGGSSVRNPWYC